MPDKEEVIKGLEYCTLQARKGWPYEPEITKSGCEISACPYIGNCGEMLFDALALLKEQNNCENCAIAIEDRQPVVRCKDCKHGAYVVQVGMLPFVTCCGVDRELDWFCADGERR